MIVNYTFKVSNWHLIPHINGLDNVIERVSWVLIGETFDSNGNKYTYEHPQTTTIKFDSDVPFISANELTPEIIQDWVFTIENKKQRDIDWLKTNIIYKRLDEKINPAISKIVKPFWEQQQ
jgi:hypothetical protein